MKNLKQKIFSILMMVAMVFSILLPGAKTAYAAGEILKVAPEQTTVNVHKVLLPQENNYVHNDEKYDPNVPMDLKDFGDNAKFIPNVYFVAVLKGDTENLNKFFGTTAEADLLKSPQPNEEQRKAIKAYADEKNKGELKYAGLTDSNGNLPLVLPKGEYYIFEIKSLSKYTGVNGELLDKMRAVPIVITLPFSAKDGSGFLKEVNVYPKNTEEGPNVEKDVTELGNKHDTADIGEYVTWYITVDVPKEIKDYTTFNIVDTMTKGLKFKEGSLKVRECNEAGKTPAERLGADISTDDYKLTQPLKDTNGVEDPLKFKVEFIVNDGHVAADFAQKYAGKKVVIEYQSLITDEAAIATAIPNNVDLEYGQNPDVKKHKEPETPPEVHTGGKRFVKVDDSAAKAKLKGATFRIARVPGNPQAEKVEDASKVEYLVNIIGTSERTWVTEKDFDAQKHTYVETVSEENTGYFEIKGLAYGVMKNDVQTGSSNYFLKETVAPAGYALNQDFIKFTVNKDSYNEGPQGLYQEVVNKKQEIPQTGGIGTIVFTAVGLLLMVTSFVALRRRASHSK